MPGLYGSFSDTNLRRSYPSIERGTLDLTPTAPEDRTHQFHLHLFQWMMDRRSHVVHRTLVNINSSLLGKTERVSSQTTSKIVVARGTHDSVSLLNENLPPVAKSDDLPCITTQILLCIQYLLCHLLSLQVMFV